MASTDMSTPASPCTVRQLSTTSLLLLLTCLLLPPVNSETQNTTNVIHSGKQTLTVLNLNFWGLGWPWGSDKDVRIRALREELLRGNYDIVLLQELWYKEDYAIVSSAMPFATPYESINSGCTSFLLPIGCSGLAVLSKFPIIEAKLVPFTHRGNFWRFDGEIFVKKGVGVARILWHEKTIDVFTTHMVSYFSKSLENKITRYLQAMETVSLIALSDADIAIFGGDLNASPIEKPQHPYGMMRSIMKDSLTEKFPSASLHPAFATFGNADNTYTHNSLPERIDYLMFRAKSYLDMKVVDFSMPLFMTMTAEGQAVSLSDHEALLGVYTIEEMNVYNESLPRRALDSHW